MKLILASGSPGRKEALEKAGYGFEVVQSNYDEDMTLPLTPAELVVHLAKGKARSVALQYDDAIVIGADTVAVFQGKVLGKPHTKQKDIEMLSMLSGNVHSMITGLTVIDTRTRKEITKSVETKILFRTIQRDEMEAYTEGGEGLEKAGGYCYQLNGGVFVMKFEGSESNIAGLPLDELREILEGLGVV